MPLPVWLRGIGSDPHDSANCPDAGKWGGHAYHDPQPTLAEAHLSEMCGHSTGKFAVTSDELGGACPLLYRVNHTRRQKMTHLVLLC